MARAHLLVSVALHFCRRYPWTNIDALSLYEGGLLTSFTSYKKRENSYYSNRIKKDLEPSVLRRSKDKSVNMHVTMLDVIIALLAQA